MIKKRKRCKQNIPISPSSTSPSSVVFLFSQQQQQHDCVESRVAVLPGTKSPVFNVPLDGWGRSTKEEWLPFTVLLCVLTPALIHVQTLAVVLGKQGGCCFAQPSGILLLDEEWEKVERVFFTLDQKNNAFGSRMFDKWLPLLSFLDIFPCLLASFYLPFCPLLIFFFLPSFSPGFFTSSFLSPLLLWNTKSVQN